MKLYWQIATAVLAILLFASVRQCRSKQIIANSVQLAAQDTITYFTNRLGTQTASINAFQLERDQFEISIAKKDSELKKLMDEFSQVKSVIKYKTIMQIDSVQIPYQDTVSLVFSRQGTLKNQWYSFSWKSTQKGVQIDSLQINTSTTIITGFKRKWFLGKQTLTTDITNTNPLITVTTIQSADVIIAQPWYKKWYVWLAIGMAGGFVVTR